MAEGQCIEPFPPEIDRGYFAAYISGFVDGEGCFRLGFTKGPLLSRFTKQPLLPRRETPNANFQVCLRADDAQILRLIQSFFGCGYLSRQYGSGNRHDSFRFVINNTVHLTSVVIPHFDRYPLLAKKRSDYVVWKQGVQLIRKVMSISIYKRGIKGAVPRWTQPRLDQFRTLYDALRAGRAFNAPAILPALPPSSEGPSLFDSL